MSLLISPVQYSPWTGQVGNLLGRLSCEVKDWTLSHARGFVKRSAILSAVGMYLKMISPDLTCSFVMRQLPGRKIFLVHSST